ncbi:MAG: PTS sugar transporter subunit IIA [Planctomycetota bacterium]|nr:MAG: PTS sugar transporter subunit IIA [Planctomycetota bacterium]
MLVQNCLSPETIEITDSADDAAEIIARMSAKLAAHLGIEQETIMSAVLTREKSRTTAFTNGAAVPHCRLNILKKCGIALMILRNPTCWDNQGHNVDTIMMIASPQENVSSNLRILANSSQLLDCAALRNKLKQAPDSNAAYKLISTIEKAVEQRRSQHGMLRELRRDQQNGTDAQYLQEVVNNFAW